MLSGPENRFIVHPQDAIAFRKALMPSGGLFPIDIRNNFDFLRSHAISDEAADALNEENYGAFLTLRREMLVANEIEFVKSLGLDYGLTSSFDGWNS
jgi:hypothetical protein